MNITTTFDLAEIAYVLADANLGSVIPVVIEKIKISVIDTDIPNLIKYQVSSTNKFHNSSFFENELTTLSNAESIADAVNAAKVTELQEKITEINDL